MEGFMTKGFTLIELLIVMVIVGLLVTVVLPKYNAALERGRAQEALTNLKAASDAMNAQYIMNDNQYRHAGVTDSDGNFVAGDYTMPRYFSAPVLDVAGLTNTKADIDVVRDGGDYLLEAHNEDGELQFILCKPRSADLQYLCENIGAELNPSATMYTIDVGR